MPENRNRIGGQPEFEIAYYTKELGKPLQREMLQRQLARFSDSSPAGTARGEDATRDTATPPASDEPGG